MMLFPLSVMIFFAKEPPDIEHQSLRQHLSCLFENDGWYFNLIYIITFGGFIGLATFLPSFYYAQFHVSKIMAGELTVLATLTGSSRACWVVGLAIGSVALLRSRSYFSLPSPDSSA